MKILMVLTSHDQLGNTGRKTGFWLEEFAAPYFVFRDAGVELTLASPKGGQPPLDPKVAMSPEIKLRPMTRFKKDSRPAREGARQYGQARRHEIRRLRHGILSRRARADVGPRRESCVDCVARIVLQFRQGDRSGLPLARCAAPRHTYQGEPLVRGKRVTGFTNEEEAEMQASPRWCRSWLKMSWKRLGAKFEKVPNWQPFSIVDGRLVTGQNPASSTSAAQALMKLLSPQGALSAAS